MLIAFGDWIGQNADKLAEIGLKIARAIIKGMAKAAWQAGLSIGETISPKEFDRLAPGAHFGLPVFKPGETAGGGTAVSITQTYNITGVSSPNDVKNMIDESNRTLTEETRRLFN